MHGDVTQTRSNCYVDDLVEGIVRFMRSDVHEPVNLGSPEEIRVIDLAHLILELSRSRSPVVRRPRAQDDPTRRCPDIMRGSSLFGWEPAVPLRYGLMYVLAWFAEHVRQRV